MGRDEASDPFVEGFTLELLDAERTSCGAKITVDNGEVIAVVFDVEHVAVCHGEAFYDRHWWNSLRRSGRALERCLGPEQPPTVAGS